MIRFLYRPDWRAILRLGLLIVTVAAWLLSPQPLFGQEADDVYELDLAALGYSTVTLEGPSDSTNYRFSIPSTWLPQAGTSLQLDLVYAVGNETGAAPALLEVRLNGTVLRVERFRVSTITQLSVEIPPTVLRLPEAPSTNDLELNLSVQAPCEEALLATLIVQSSSNLHFVYRERPLDLDLAFYPKPLYYPRAFEATPVHIVLPPQPSVGELESAAMIAADLGAQTFGNLPLEVSLGGSLAVTATQQHLLVIGSPERMDLLSDLDLPLQLRQRSSSLRSQMPVSVTLGQPFSYTLIAENTSNASQEFSVEDRLTSLVHVEACQGCRLEAPGLVRWDVGILAPGQAISAIVRARPDESLSIGEEIEHTASLLDAAGQVVNVDTLSTTVALEGDDIVVSSPAKGPYFFVLDGQGVPETDGIIQFLASPWSAQRALLAVTGLNDAAVNRAARALVTPGDMPGMRGEFAVVQATSPIMGSAAPRSQDMTLAEMGYSDVVRVGRVNSTGLNFRVPLGAKLDEKAYMALHMAHGTAFDTISATLELRLNNLPIYSVPLKAGNAVDNWISVPLPRQRIWSGLNDLSIDTAADWPPCMGEDERAGFWVTIYEDSFLHLPYEHQTGAPTLDLADYPRFLFTQPGLEDVVVLFPAQVTPDEVEKAMQMFSFLGDAARDEYFAPRIALADEAAPERWRAYHLIVVGQPNRNPYITLANDQLPQPFIISRNEVQQSVDSVVYWLPPGYDLGCVQLLPVPWNTTRAMLVVTGTTDDGLRWAQQALADYGLSRQLRGNLALLVQEGDMRTTDTRQPVNESEVGVDPARLASVMPPEKTGTPTVIPPTATPLAAMSTPVVSVATPTVAGSASTMVADHRPVWLMPLLIISILGVIAFIGIHVWRARS